MKPKQCTAYTKKINPSSCLEVFLPQRPLQEVCSPLCGAALARWRREKKDKAQRKDWYQDKKKFLLNDKPFQLREAQNAFNRYIVLRDKHEPCISCGRYHEGQYQAGHYRTVKAAPELRFDEDNCHKQCVPCNHKLSGNIVGYRKRLINKIGTERVEILEGPHPARKYTTEELIELKEMYKQKYKALLMA
jgi:hypothetical protein